MKTLGQLADRLADLVSTEDSMRDLDKQLERPMLPARRADLQAERDTFSARRDAIRAEELSALLHKP